MPTVSILIPVHNTEQYVAQAVESVLNQSFTDFELIVIDDGSTDESPAILRRMADSDSRIRLVHRGPQGIVASRNEALGLATGEFCAVLDSDDIALPNRLMAQVTYLREHPECVAVGGQVLTIDSDGDPIMMWDMPTSHEEIDRIALREGRPGILHSTLFARRSVLLELGGYRTGLDTAEDHDICLRLAERGRLANLPIPVVQYRLHPRSVTRTRAELQHRLTSQILRDAYRRRGLDGEPPDFPGRSNQTATDYHLTCGWQALMAGHLPTARKHAWAALGCSPLAIAPWRLAYCTMRNR